MPATPKVQSWVYGSALLSFHQALSRADEADVLREKWEAAYLQAFPARSGVATFFVMAPGPGACCV